MSNIKYPQIKKTRENIVDRYGYEKKEEYYYHEDSKIPLVRWDETDREDYTERDLITEGHKVLTWKKKVEIFQEIIPTEQMILDKGIDDRLLYLYVNQLKEDDEDSKTLIWLQLTYRYLREWSFWFFTENLKQDDSFVRMLANDLVNLVKERATKKMDKDLDSFLGNYCFAKGKSEKEKEKFKQVMLSALEAEASSDNENNS